MLEKCCEASFAEDGEISSLQFMLSDDTPNGFHVVLLSNCCSYG